MVPRQKRLGRGLSRGVPRLVLLLLCAGMAGIVVAGMILPFVAPPGILARDAIENFEDLPEEFRAPALPAQTVLYAADGTKLATVFEENRREVTLAQIAPVMQKAIVAIEDARFYEHKGFDPRGMARAALTNLESGQVSQGGSTLTMQYVKNVLLTSAMSQSEQAAAREDTITRKLREVRYSMALENRLTKDEILTRYLNISYFGAKAYGVEAASRRYFSKSAKDLTLVEAATLAGTVQRPSQFDPTRNPAASQDRRDQVLTRMAELGYITTEQATAAKAIPVKKYLKPKVQLNGCTSSVAPFFCDYAIRMARQMQALGATEAQREAAWRAGGLKIHTTLDMKSQEAAVQAAMNAIPATDPSGKAVAMTMIEPGTGNVVAMAQNRKWGVKGKGRTTYNYNVDLADGGTQGMQAGSTFKVFTVAAALEAGISPFEVINSPKSATFSNWPECAGGGTYEDFTTGNSTRSGRFDMFRGSAYSVNTYFMELERRASLCRTVDVATRMGLKRADGKPIVPYPSFTLGSDEVSPLTMANVYATISAHGVHCEPRVIDRVTDRNGQAVSVPAPRCTQAITRNVADGAAAVLTNVVDGSIPGRTGKAMTIGRDTTGKTGTTTSHAAVWFAGATPDLSTAVWVGDPRGGFRHPLTNVEINGRFYREVFGSSLPGPVWKSAMLGALADTPPVAMDLTNEWGLLPARQAGSPRQQWRGGYGSPWWVPTVPDQPGAEAAPLPPGGPGGAGDPGAPAGIPIP